MKNSAYIVDKFCLISTLTHRKYIEEEKKMNLNDYFTLKYILLLLEDRHTHTHTQKSNQHQKQQNEEKN